MIQRNTCVCKELPTFMVKKTAINGKVLHTLKALITHAFGESPIVITTFQWYARVTDLGTSKSTTFTLQNGGSVPLVIRNIRLRTKSSFFSLTPSTPLPATLAPSQEIQVEITFSAESEGLQRASIEVDYIELTP
jgi:hypothetical protein